MILAPVRVLQGSPVTLTYQSLDADGEPSTADPGTVTVGVVRADATVLVAAGTATSGSGASRTYTISAANTALLDELTVTWTAAAVTLATTTVSVVGGYLVSTAEMRALEPSLADTIDDNTASLIRARSEVAAMFERACGNVLSFVPRFSATTHGTVSGPGELWLPHYKLRRVRWMTWVSGTTTTTVDLSSGLDIDPAGFIYLRSGTWPWAWTYPTTVTVGYEHGFDAPPPDVKRAAAAAVRRQVNLARSMVDSRAMSYQGPGGEVTRYPTPGLGSWVTGVPEIDEVLISYSKRYPKTMVA